jgi:hypothetical protein
VQPPHFKVVYGQCVHTPAFHSECANRETPDRERSDRGRPEGERAECDGAKSSSPIVLRQCLLSHGIARRRFDLSNVSLPNLHVVHGAPRTF